ncbi:MAG TPA: alpha-hydroxy acid oxidase [Chloroflexota bacterium]|nr:alpha-hydroxy acid oxidase [Chloroflexota bacterium]
MAVTAEFLTLPELRRAARAKLAPAVWDYVAGGADSEATLRNNRRAMSRYVFRPRVLRDVSRVDLRTTFLGMPLALPIMTAPMGSLEQVHPDGDLAMARAAGRMGTIHWLTTQTASTPEAVSAAASGPLVFQLYFRGDYAWAEALIRRVEAAGFRALALTVDNAAYGRRERDIVRRRESRNHPTGLGLPPGRGRMGALTWADVDWLRATTRLPLIVKGIQDPEDARLAAEHGVAAVHLSNHGGRNLDYSPAPIDILADSVAAVAGRAEVIVDGGFQRGTDVLKALALGARAVVIGKAAAWGLGAAGEEGVVRTLELLALELCIAMANTGQARVADVGPALVQRACRAG